MPGVSLASVFRGVGRSARHRLARPRDLVSPRSRSGQDTLRALALGAAGVAKAIDIGARAKET
jgi:hypothetical protein